MDLILKNCSSLSSQFITADICGRDWFEIALMDYYKFSCYGHLNSLAIAFASNGGLNEYKLSLLESYI